VCLLVLLTTTSISSSEPVATLHDEAPGETRHLRQAAIDWSARTRLTLKQLETYDYEQLLRDIRVSNPARARDAYYLQDQVGVAMVRQCALNVWRLVDDNLLSRAAGLAAEAVCNEAHQMVKTVDFTVATDGTYLPEFQVAQLRKVFKKATHDAHAIGFKTDAIRAPSIPPLPRFPGLPGVWADPSWAPDRPSSPDGTPAYPNPPRPPSPPMVTLASLLRGPLFTPPPPPPPPARHVQAVCGRGKHRHLCALPPAPPPPHPLPVGLYLVSGAQLELKAAEIALKMFTNVTTPPPPRPGVPPPHTPPPHHPHQPEAQRPPSTPLLPSPPDFTRDCQANREGAIKATLRFKFCLFHQQPALPAWDGRRRRSLLGRHERARAAGVRGLPLPGVALVRSEKRLTAEASLLNRRDAGAHGGGGCGAATHALHAGGGGGRGAAHGARRQPSGRQRTRLRRQRRQPHGANSVQGSPGSFADFPTWRICCTRMGRVLGGFPCAKPPRDRWSAPSVSARVPLIRHF
jgi:hypothetical protein